MARASQAAPSMRICDFDFGVWVTPQHFFTHVGLKPYLGRPKQISRHVLRQSQCMPWSTMPFVWLAFGPERVEI